MMERDFLGMNGGKEDIKGSRYDAGLAVQWPFTNKVSAMQQFMPYKAAQDEKTNKYGFDQLSSSTFQPVSVVGAFEVNHSSTPSLSQQKSFSLHDYQPQGTTATFTASPHQFDEARTFPMFSHYSTPVTTTNNSFFKFHGTQSAPSLTVTTLNQHPLPFALNTPVVNTAIGAPAPRNLQKPTPMTSQLTIFYAGAVHVYDDVPFDKAQAIMMLASKGSNGTSNVARSEAPLSVTAPVPLKVAGSDSLNAKQILNPTPVRVASPCSGFLNPISVTSHAVAISRSGSNTKNDTVGAKVVGNLAPSTQQEPSRTSSAALGSKTAEAIIPQAVPQARKASLARFLEKRKERVHDAMPYSAIKKTSDTGGSRLESAHASSILSSAADVNLSSSRADSWGGGCPKHSTDSGESPSTKLGI